jgi:hypothetical protein
MLTTDWISYARCYLNRIAKPDLPFHSSIVDVSVAKPQLRVRMGDSATTISRVLRRQKDSQPYPRRTSYRCIALGEY